MACHFKTIGLMISSSVNGWINGATVAFQSDSLLAGMGGQTGLNLAVDLHDAGILEKYNVKVIKRPVYADQLEVKTLSHCLFVELNNRYELSINSLVFVSFGISITQCSVFYIC